MTEHDEQAALFEWAERKSNQYPELGLLFAIPNGAKLPWTKNSKGQRYSKEAMRLKAEGLKPGVPDMFLPVPRKDFSGLFVELKYGKNQPSDVQVQWLDALSQQKFLATVCWGWDEARQVISEYLGIKD